MARALQRRDVDRRALSDYILDEVESLRRPRAGSGARERGASRIHVVTSATAFTSAARCRFDGVSDSRNRSPRYESDWMHSEQAAPEARTEQAAEREKTGGTGVHGVANRAPLRVGSRLLHGLQVRARATTISPAGIARRPQRAEDRLLPTKLFERRTNDRRKEARRSRSRTIDRKMNKTVAGHALGRSRSAPDRQVHVRERLAGLPAGRMARDGSTTCARRWRWNSRFPGVWLPRNISIHGGVTVALGIVPRRLSARLLRTIAKPT